METKIESSEILSKGPSRALFSIPYDPQYSLAGGQVAV